MRHEFTTEDNTDIGVLVHHDGRREILVYDSDDPDKCSSLVTLSAADTRTVSELLGASRVTEAVVRGAAGNRGTRHRVDRAHRNVTGVGRHDR